MGATLVDTSRLRPAFCEEGQDYNCRAKPPSWWFDLIPQSHQFSSMAEFRVELARVTENRRRALELCSTCPCRVACREFARTEGVKHGIFGGEILG